MLDAALAFIAICSLSLLVAGPSLVAPAIEERGPQFRMICSLPLHVIIVFVVVALLVAGIIVGG